MTGTFGGALEARGVDAGGGKLTSEVTGEVELDGKVLVIKRIHAHYRLAGEGLDEAVVARVHDFHADKCPVARSIRAAIEVTTSYELV
ncbi:MAG: OsmC family protein [Actinomycetota bacterium]